MKPILLELAGLQVTSYGMSKALAALVAGLMIARDLRFRGRDPELAYPLVLVAVVGGLVGAKLYYLAEHAGSVSVHDLGGTGFTWYGGLIGGALATAGYARRAQLPAGFVAGLAAAPLAAAYGVGRLGCLLAGDGTYGTRSDLPWAMSFPEGTVPTLERVHPTPLYEAIVALAIAALLWRLRTRMAPVALFALFAVLMGTARLLVEFVRLNDEFALGLTQPQLWSVAMMAAGLVVLVRASAVRGMARVGGTPP